MGLENCVTECCAQIVFIGRWYTMVMTKELDIKKIITQVQTEADKKNQKRFDGMMEVLNDKFKVIQEQFMGVHEKLDSHTEMIGNVAMDLTEVKSDLLLVKLEVQNLIQDKVENKHFVALEGRVRILEKK